MIKNTKYFALALLFFVPYLLFSQQDEQKYSFGLFGGFLINLHSADFKKIPDCPSCSPGYESGSGTGFSFGGLFEYKLSPLFTIGGRLSYNNQSAKLTRTEGTTVILNGVATAGEFEHSIEATLATIGFEPKIKYNFWDNFNVSVGIFGGGLITKDYSQKEEITKPSGVGTFADENGNDTKRRVRNDTSGTLSKAASFMLAPSVGISYCLPLNKQNTWILEPEAYYYLGMTNVVDDPVVNSWKANYVQIGVAIKYSPKKEKEQIRKHEKIQKFDTLEIKKDFLAQSFISKGRETSKTVETPDGEIILVQEIISRTDTLFAPKVYAFAADINALGVDASGNEIKNPKFIIEEFVSNKMKPLLNYIFFDDNSAKLPSKYKMLKTSETESFQINNLYSSETLDIYYNILNIIGRRLSDNEAANLQIVGCNSDLEKEKGNKELSADRADVVKQYLVDVWKIDESRITTESRNLPEKPSTPITEPEKLEENRRVEFYSNNYEILAPVFLADTIRTANPPLVRFYPEIKSEAGIKNWSITAYQEQNQKMNNFYKEGSESAPKSLDWTITEPNSSAPRFNAPINYQLKVTDKANKEIKTNMKSLPIELVTITKKREMGLQDKIIEDYSLILFDFDKWDVFGTNKKIVDFVKKRIESNSTVLIEGFTDRTGEDDYNKKLSEKRAVSVKNAIGNKEAQVNGVGEEKLLFDNNIPEGRFYCRTVNIRIETPTK